MQRGNHYHIACCVNVGRIPAIAGHDDFVGQSGLIDCIPYVDPAFQNAGALTDNHEPRTGMFFENQRRRFDQLKLSFVRSNHPHVTDQRYVVTDTDFTAEFCSVARRLEFHQIDS